ncbi:MAG: hypothetical protein NT033_07210, partial [Candidatus Omnitrophica bacterium]|nr:hypothetical protein [Candidatus Omnitrophota bacterium]
LDLKAGTIWFQKDEVESINGYSVESWKQSLPTQEAFKEQNKNQAILSSAQEGLNFVSKTRRLEFKTMPWVEVCTREELKRNLMRLIEKENSEAKVDTAGKLLLKLGLLSDLQEYKREASSLLTEQVAGYYSDEDKRIYVTDDVLLDILPGIPSITIMHEQMHALQDQYHDLKKIKDALFQGNDDKAMAMQGVIEGEATVLMYDAYFNSVRGAGFMGKEDKILDIRSFVIDSMLAYSKRIKSENNQPAIFMEDTLFPYVYGGTFIQYIVNTRGWDAVDAIYKDPPVSSEQIMHPEKYYIMRDAPKEVNLPDISSKLGSSWVRLTRGVLGEFSFYLVGKNFLDELSAKLMSEGWGGDTFELYEEPASKQLLLISLSKWDTERDAEEAFSLYKKIIVKRYKNPALIKEDANFSQWKTTSGSVYLSKDGDSIIHIDGASETLLLALLGALNKAK